MEKVAAVVKKTEITVLGISRADHATPLHPLKWALTSPINRRRVLRPQTYVMIYLKIFTVCIH
jgi:hypothetical protein